jgi:hypothetical protein
MPRKPPRAYEEQLLRTPNRTPALKALARAKSAEISMATVKPYASSLVRAPFASTGK